MLDTKNVNRDSEHRNKNAGKTITKETKHNALSSFLPLTVIKR